MGTPTLVWFESTPSSASVEVWPKSLVKQGRVLFSTILSTGSTGIGHAS